MRSYASMEWNPGVDGAVVEVCCKVERKILLYGMQNGRAICKGIQGNLAY